MIQLKYHLLTVDAGGEFAVHFENFAVQVGANGGVKVGQFGVDSRF